jgi:hypothetical protein
VKRAILAAGAILAALALGGWWLMDRNSPEVVRVERLPLVFTVDVEGQLESISSTTLGPPPVQSMWNFKISFLAPEGKEVQEGEPVLRFETSELDRRRAEAASELDRSRAELETTNTDLEISQRRIELRLAEARATLRRSELALAVPPELIGRRELDAARVDHDLATRQIRAIEAELEAQLRASGAERAALEARAERAQSLVQQLDREIASLTVKAPGSGTIVYVSEAGREKPKVGDSTWRGGKLVEIPDLTKMRVRAEVDESSLGRVEVGQAATLRLDAHLDLELRGTVSQIRRSVQSRSAGEPRRIARLWIDLETTDRERMRPGMRVRGELEVGRTEPVPAVPLTAVTPTPTGPMVQRQGWLGRSRQVAVELGRRDAEHVEILGGLAVGDQLLAGGGA